MQWANFWASDLQLLPHLTSYTLRGHSQWTLMKSVLEFALNAFPRAQLRTLELDTTWMDDNVLRALCEATLPALRTLKLLNVRRHSLWRDLAVALKRLLPCGVEVLYISAKDSPRVSGEGEDDWDRSADALTSLTLRGLSWPHNDLSCTLFRHAPRLRHLSLDVEPYHSNLPVYESKTYDFSKILDLELRGSGVALAQWLHRAKNATKITLELTPTDSESIQNSGSRFKRQLVGEVRFPALRELRTTNITFTVKEIVRLRRVIAHPLLTLVVNGVEV
ncbi:hypothetical protein EXIGLDRAFT_828406 [Exidia glandulosa HHB12029]|uniref:Uncharacterized protein n=1 Tax=Exidia glandulosa HHB12029 TaxID=1314781 RepID=A0A165QF59_EXIGL|nr:hypothetical protein EXIGLDRAFT_828406 [Exidia glandulosa HHB12029]